MKKNRAPIIEATTTPGAARAVALVPSPETPVRAWARSPSRWLLVCVLAACGGGGKSGEGPKIAPDKAPPAGPSAEQSAKQKFEQASAQLKAMEKAGKVDYAALRASFEAALSDDPRMAEAYHNLGVIAEVEGKSDEALQQYQNALKANPKFAPAAENAAGVLVAQAKIDEAQKLLEAFVAAEPAAPRPRVALAAIYHDKKNYSAALEQCRAALQREPKNLLAFEQMTVTYSTTGNVPMARLVAARGLKVDAKDATIHHVLGKLLLGENKIPEAVIEFKLALEKDPSFRPARIDLAEVALQYRDFGNAKAHYTELVRQQPNDTASLLGLGIANKGLNVGDEAKAAYEKVLALDPKSSAAKMNLAILHHRTLNDFPSALKYYQAYMEAPVPEGPKVEEIKGWIAELEATIAALKEAEKLEQMEKERAATQPAQPDAAPEQPASAPASAPAG